MKVLFIESIQKNLKFDIPNKELNKLPRRIFLAYSIQYKELAKQIKKQLEKNKIKISKFQQVLGCSKISTKLPLLFIGTGRFHAINLYLQSPEIYLLENKKIIKIPSIQINKIKAKRRTALMKFLSAKNIGILVTTKPGQEQLKQTKKLKQKLLKKGKKVYIFLSNNIDINQFENFNIQSWINTACPGLSIDNPQIINHSEVLEYI